MSLLTRTLCAVLGGHHWTGPRVQDGRLRLTCGYGCGAQSEGIQTRGQELAKVRPINLRQHRSARDVWQARKSA